MLVLANMLVLLLLWLPVGLCRSLPKPCSVIPTYNFVAGCTKVPCYLRFCMPHPPRSSGSSSASAAAAWADPPFTTSTSTTEAEEEEEVRWAHITLDQSPSRAVSVVEYAEKGTRSSTTTNAPGSEESHDAATAGAPADPLLSFLGVLLTGAIVGSGLFSWWWWWRRRRQERERRRGTNALIDFSGGATGNKHGGVGDRGFTKGASRGGELMHAGDSRPDMILHPPLQPEPVGHLPPPLSVLPPPPDLGASGECQGPEILASTTFAGMGGGANIYNVVSSASKMAGRRRQQMASTIEQSFSRTGGSTHPTSLEGAAAVASAASAAGAEAKEKGQNGENGDGFQWISALVAQEKRTSVGSAKVLSSSAAGRKATTGAGGAADSRTAASTSPSEVCTSSLSSTPVPEPRPPPSAAGTSSSSSRAGEKMVVVAEIHRRPPPPSTASSPGLLVGFRPIGKATVEEDKEREERNEENSPPLGEEFQAVTLSPPPPPEAAAAVASTLTPDVAAVPPEVSINEKHQVFHQPHPICQSVPRSLSESSGGGGAQQHWEEVSLFNRGPPQPQQDQEAAREEENVREEGGGGGNNSKSFSPPALDTNLPSPPPFDDDDAPAAPAPPAAPAEESKTPTLPRRSKRNKVRKSYNDFFM